MGRYDAFARFLAGHGFAVCGEDHLGHGKTVTDGVYGYFGQKNGWWTVTEDIRQLRQRMGEQFPGVPYFLLGHSMGSFLTRTYLCRYPGTVDGAILSGTGQENALLVEAGKLLASLTPCFKGPDYVSTLVNSLVTGGLPQAVQAHPHHRRLDQPGRGGGGPVSGRPFCTFTPTVGMFRDMLGGLQYIASEKALSQMDPSTPVYLFSGDQDPVGSNGKGVRKVYGYFQKHGTRDLQLKLYPRRAARDAQRAQQG